LGENISSNFLFYKGKRKYMSELLTVSEVARILRVDDTTVRRWVKQGALEAVILPHVNERQAYRIKRETLEKVLGDASLELRVE
jgi:excisionase family DNA binding protein